MVGGEGAAILWRDGPGAGPAGTAVDAFMEENRNAGGAAEVSEAGLGAKVNPEDPEPNGAEVVAAEEEESALVTEKTNDDDDVGGAGPLAVGTTLKVPAVAERVEAAVDARPRLGNAAGAESTEAALLGGCTANEPADSKDYVSLAYDNGVEVKSLCRGKLFHLNWLKLFLFYVSARDVTLTRVQACSY